MAVTLGSTGITFPDATTQTTAASGSGAPQATFTAAAAITAGQVVQFTTGTNVQAVAGATLDGTKIIGIANASASSSAPVLVNLFGGTDANQTGLTPNSTYYVNAAGALTTTSTAPNVKIGRATSATSILIKGLTI
jgi:hypothetical protein